MHVPRKPWWQQATAVVSLGAGGAVTGLHFAPSPAADIQSPSNVQVRLMALRQAAAPAPSDDATLRSAIVNVATYYLRMAAGKTPAEMEELIWQRDSTDGVDHGQSCAAFASLTLELAAQVVGRQSWVTGGTSYPWPLHKWVDARVDPNPASLGVTSVLQDAEAHHRWHPLGDGYTPRPGDWVLFDGHVEVVTKYAGGVLSTIGGDSLPNYSVNAHTYSGPLSSDGVAGFVNNGDLSVTAAPPAQASGKRFGSQSTADQPGRQSAIPAAASGSAADSGGPASAADSGGPASAADSGGPASAADSGGSASAADSASAAGSAEPAEAGGATGTDQAESPDDAMIPGMPTSLVARRGSAGGSGSAEGPGRS